MSLLMFRKLGLVLGLGVLLWLGLAEAGVASTSALVPNGQQQYADANGTPYAGGSVCFYVPGTTTPSLTYQDPGLTVPNTSPCVTLNSAGRAIIWGSGEYRQILYNSFGTLIWDQLVSAGVGNGASVSGLTCASCTLTGATLGGTTTVSVSGTFLLPDGSAWTSSGLTPSGNPIPFAALTKIATGTLLGNVSGLSASPSALTGGQVSGALCQPQQTVETSGSSATYTTPTCNGVTATWLKIRMVGGGGGSGGNGTSPGNGGAGGNTTFGSLAANGGGPSSGNGSSGGSGGTASGGALNLTGANGGTAYTGQVANESGGGGGSSPFGGAGNAGGNSGSIAAGAGQTNTGSGAGGPGGNASAYSVGGGGAGGYVEGFITAPSATYTYTVGAGGTAGTNGSSGYQGAAGGSGVIVIEAGWQ